MIDANKCSTSAAAGTTPLLDVANLSIKMGTKSHPRLLVHDVSMSVRAGDVLGIVGESGSGKSLTARALVRLLPPNLQATGDITFNGIQLQSCSQRELRRVRGNGISLLLQDPFTMLNPLQTVHTHIAESLPTEAKRSRPEVNAEVSARLGEVGLSPDVAKRYPFQLSGGMQQRVALAAALAKDPRLLIADEPTTALDVTTQAEILALIKRVQQQRDMALILITHDLRLAFSVCDAIQVMYAGSIAELAPVSELASRPAHPYSLGLLRADLPVTHYLDKIPSIPGRVPSADDVMDRCSFADRCGWVEDRCIKERPLLLTTGPGRATACLRSDEIADDLQADLDDGRVPSARGPKEHRTVGDALVEVSHLRKRYWISSLIGAKREVIALDNVSLHIGDGESVGLVGETGSGKTTVTRCILGLTQADEGTIQIEGVDATNFSKLKREQRRRIRASVQVIFQDPYASLNPALTVASTLREALEFGGSRSYRLTPAELLDSVGLPASFARRRPAALSGGERQRVAIARALAVRPRLLICDEPVASLDVSAQAQILELLRQIRCDTGMSMLFVTHDLSVVRQMTERLVVLYNGKVVEDGFSHEVLNQPRHEYTRRLVAAVPTGIAPNKPGDPQAPTALGKSFGPHRRTPDGGVRANTGEVNE